MRNVFVATGNPGKIQEMCRIVTVPGLQFVPAGAQGVLPAVIEDGKTFRENAEKKALTCARANNAPAVADDSGLEVTALEGAPGIFSARYAGENANDEDNIRKLLNALRDENERSACFTCVIAVAEPDGTIGTAEGRLYGRIIDTPAGSNGFGYDPVFVPQDYNVTLAQMSGEEKNDISHRAQALQRAVDKGVFAELKHNTRNT